MSHRHMPPDTTTRFPTSRRRLTPVAEFALVFLILLIWTAFVYIPFYRLEGPDDAFYLEAASLWTRGAPPYVGAFDVKPPGFFALLVLAEALAGPGLAALRIVAIPFTALAATLLWFLGRSLLGRASGMACAIVYPILFEIFGDTAYAPLCALTILAFVCAMSSLSPFAKAALSGLAIGVACTIKQTAVCEALALLILLSCATQSPASRWRGAAMFVVAAAVTPLAFLIYYGVHGEAGPLVSDVIVLAVNRPASPAESISFLQGIARMMILQGPLLPITLAAVFALVNHKTLAKTLPIGALGLWLSATVFSIVVQRAISPYYFTPALAPLLLLAAGGVTMVPAERRLSHAKLALFGAVAVLGAIAFRGIGVLRLALTSDPVAIGGAAAAIKSTAPLPSDKLFVVSRGGLIYGASGLDPPTPYFQWSHTLCDFPGAGLARIAEAMAARPRYVIIADRTRRYPCEQPSHWAVVDTALTASYRHLTRVNGDNDSFDILELK